MRPLPASQNRSRLLELLEEIANIYCMQSLLTIKYLFQFFSLVSFALSLSFSPLVRLADGRYGLLRFPILRRAELHVRLRGPQDGEHMDGNWCSQTKSCANGIKPACGLYVLKFGQSEMTHHTSDSDRFREHSPVSLTFQENNHSLIISHYSSFVVFPINRRTTYSICARSSAVTTSRTATPM